MVVWGCDSDCDVIKLRRVSSLGFQIWFRWNTQLSVLEMVSVVDVYSYLLLLLLLLLLLFCVSAVRVLLLVRVWGFSLGL